MALALINELERVLTRMATHPGTGSSRYAHDLGLGLGLPGLRFRLLRKYPYVVFYVEQESSMVVWRVLHGHRDIPAWLGDGA